MIRYIIFFLIATVLLQPDNVWSDLERYKESLGGSTQWEPSDSELTLLPSYCKCKLRGNDNRWKNKCPTIMEKFRSFGDRGKDSLHLHHYCAGLLMLNRLFRGVGERSALLDTAEKEFNYVIKHSHQDFILMPEILVKMGITKRLKGNDAEAIRYFYQAIKLKKNYTEAYIQIANYYQEIKDYKNALKIVKMGLNYSPNSALLKQKLSQLHR